MNKLLTITLRWMRRDKKRTLLSFLSIVMAMYMLTFLGVYFSAGVSMIRSENAYADGNWHVSFECTDPDQAMLITKNASVEKGGFATDSGFTPYMEEHIKKYWLSDRQDKNYIPYIRINGKDMIRKSGVYVNNDLFGYAFGDISELYRYNGKPRVEGRLPSKSGEVLITREAADYYGLSVGDTMTIEYSAQKVKAEYADFFLTTEEANEPVTIQQGDTTLTFDRSNFLRESLKNGLDENGDPIKLTAADDDAYLGKVLMKMTSDVVSASSEITDPEELNHLISFQLQLLSADVNSMIANSVTEGSYEIFESYNSDTDQRCLTVLKLTMLPEADAKETLSFTVSGISSDSLGENTYTTIYFSPEDETIKPHLPVTSRSGEHIICYTRIKDGLDIDTETAQICRSAEIPPNGTVPEHDYVSQNNSLIYLEGRGFERNQGIALIFCLMIIVVAVFVFFARLIINNAFELSSAYRLTQYGALKTVGTSDRQIFAMIMIECMIYMLTALPIAIVLALFTGRLVLDKIADLKIFDLIYGDGVTENFIKLEIIPVLFIAAVGVAVFSVVMSAYACAIRIRKLSPIEAATSGKRTKKIKAKKHGWLSRRLFGFSVGYAIRSIRKNRMRFSITLLAAVVSGTLVVTLANMARTTDKFITAYSEVESDFEAYPNIITSAPKSIPDEVAYLEKSGMFSSVEPFIYSISHISPELVGGDLPDKLTEFFKGNGVNLKIISKDIFKKIRTDISYDDLVASKGALLCKTCTAGNYGKDLENEKTLFCQYFFGSDTPPCELEFRTVTDKRGLIGLYTDSIPVYTEIPKELTVLITNRMNIGDEYKLELPVAGVYSADKEYLCNTDEKTPMVLLPIETLDTFMKDTDAEKIQELLFYSRLEVTLTAAEGKEMDAKQFLIDRYGEEYFSDHIIEKLTAKKVSEAVKTAGYSLAFILMALALINMLSTSAATVVNRRNEFSMLRACGMSLRQVIGSLAAEAILISLLNAVISAFLGLLLSSFLVEFFISENIHFSFITPIAIFLMTLTVTLLPYLFTLRRMSKDSIPENIRKKE